MAENNDELRNAAHDLVMQAYGSKRHGSHAPTRMQWMRLASAVEACGVRMPADWEQVFSEEKPTRLREDAS